MSIKRLFARKAKFWCERCDWRAKVPADITDFYCWYCQRPMRDLRVRGYCAGTITRERKGR
jgi:Zn finger protein HypA/HybF involved in hydrogenase expression